MAHKQARAQSHDLHTGHGAILDCNIRTEDKSVQCTRPELLTIDPISLAHAASFHTSDARLTLSGIPAATPEALDRRRITTAEASNIVAATAPPCNRCFGI